MVRLKSIVVSAVVGMGFISGASAGVISTDLAFTTVEDQSLWNGSSSSAWESSGTVGGDASISYSVGVLNGTVKAGFDGNLAITHDDRLTSPGNTRVSLDFAGEDSGGFVETKLDHWIRASYDIDVSHDFGFPFGRRGVDESGNIINHTGVDARIEETFTPSLDMPPVEGNDSLSSGDLLPLDLRIVDVGFDYDVYEDIFFDVLSLNGSLNYKHEGASIWNSQSFSMDRDAAFDIDLDLDASGLWEFFVSDLMLGNEFQSDIRYEIDPSIEIDILGWGPSWSWDIDGHLYDQAFVPLEFMDVPDTEIFSMYVEAGSTSIPAPTTTLLMTTGLLGLFRLRRRACR